MKTLGEIIEERLSILQMSQRTLAKEAGVDVSYINKLIKNKSTSPSFNIVMQIANILKISNADLENIYNIKFKNNEDIADNFKKLDTFAQKDKVMEIVNAIIEKNDNELKNISDIIYKIAEFKNMGKKQTYYIINKFDNELKILKTNTIDIEFIYLYSSFLGCNSNDFLIIQGNIKDMPRNCNITTLNDIIDSLDEDREDFEELKEYIQKIL